MYSEVVYHINKVLKYKWWTQRDFADRCRISYYTLIKIMRWAVVPKLHTFQRMVSHLRVLRDTREIYILWKRENEDAFQSYKRLRELSNEYRSIARQVGLKYYGKTKKGFIIKEYRELIKKFKIGRKCDPIEIQALRKSVKTLEALWVRWPDWVQGPEWVRRPEWLPMPNIRERPAKPPTFYDFLISIMNRDQRVSILFALVGWGLLIRSYFYMVKDM